MDVSPDKDGILLGTLFQKIISDWKSSSPAWDDFVNKGCKFHNSLKSTTVAMSAFVDSMQKIADAATTTKGSTKDVGSALTRICVRQKLVETKLKQFTNAFMDKLIIPIQEKLDEWKKTANLLEKDHAKEFKRATTEIKKRKDDSLRLQKKARKGSKPDVHYQLNLTVQDVKDRCNALEETEKSALRNLLVEERTRICLFANALSPLLDLQVAMMNEVNHLQDLNLDMMNLCRNPKQLPTSTDELVKSFMSANSDHASALQHDERPVLQSSEISPSLAEKNENLSTLITTDGDSRPFNGLHRSSTVRLRQNFEPNQKPLHRRTSSSGGSNASSYDVDHLSSVSSRDSGFVSTESADMSSINMAIHSTFKNPFGNSNDKILQSSLNSFNPSQPVADQPPPVPGHLPKFSWKDWKIPGPYELAQNKNLSESLALQNPPPVSPKPVYLSHNASIDDAVFQQESLSRSANNLPPNPPLQSDVADICNGPLPPPPSSLLSIDFDQIRQEKTPRPLSDPSQKQLSPNYIRGNGEYHTLTLGRKNSNYSLQYSASSGYSSRFTTPACSEDTIASHDTDSSSQDSPEANSRKIRKEKYSTLPRNYHHGKENVLRTFQAPLNSAEIACSPYAGSHGDISRTATIRRTPSAKLNSVRLQSAFPKPIKTPTVPTGGAVANLLSTFVPPSGYVHSDTRNNGTLF